MGLDLALGAIILMAAVRGWSKGFVSQAVRIGSFLACFYLADPIRDQARPYVQAKLPAIEPALTDRFVWWTAVVLSYIVLVGLATLAFQLLRTPPAPGAIHIRRDDRFAGVLLGASKGLLVAAVLAAAVQRYGAEVVQRTEWAGRQVHGSQALRWTEQYQPVPRIWAAPPVRQFVQHIQRNGLPAPSETEPAKGPEERTATSEGPGFRPPHLDLPAEAPPADPASRALDLDPEVVRELEKYREEFQSRDRRR